MDFEMPEIDFPEIEWKKVLIVIAGIILILFVYFSFNISPINAYFQPSHVFEQNTEGTLIVEARNNLEEDVIAMKVTAGAVNPNTIQISDYEQEESYVGAGQLRKFEFPVEVTDARAGTYSIEITLELGDKEFSQRVSLEVK